MSFRLALTAVVSLAGCEKFKVGRFIETQKATVTIPTVTTPSSAERAIRLTLEAEPADPEQREQLQREIPRIRQSIFTYLADRPLKGLSGSEAMDRCKHDLLAEINRGPVKLKALYFTEFIEY